MTTTEDLSAIRSYWDVDAATYDRAAAHVPRSGTELATWRAALARFLPPPPARILDAGAGTGFLSLLCAQLGHQVTAVELAPAMLERLRAKAAELGVAVSTREGDATAPPAGEFDAVVERHVLWTLADPSAALGVWRRAAPAGRLVCFESEWGTAADGVARLRAAARERLRRLRNEPPEHHDEYPADLRARLPLGGGTDPDRLVALTEAAGWRPARLERLRDVEWAAARSLGSPLERLLGVPSRFAVVAG